MATWASIQSPMVILKAEAYSTLLQISPTFIAGYTLC